MKTTAYAILAVLSLASFAAADLLTFQPENRDLSDLPHENYFTWGINVPLGAGQVITGASLTFANISDWTDEPNKLYVNLLDSAPLGVRTYTDHEGGGNNFATSGISLVTYVNLPTTGQTLVYNFTAPQLATLNQYIANGGNIALGIDPDCHFYNDGLSLQLGSSPVPEPASMGLIGLGGLAMLVRRCRRGQK